MKKLFNLYNPIIHKTYYDFYYKLSIIKIL